MEERSKMGEEERDEQLDIQMIPVISVSKEL